ncbi:MAG TPA: hypothetical protein VK021_00255 [Flavobacteriaceae bacterium]|nr:hypothetical protein [Flavobacteriaceae bacterium]
MKSTLKVLGLACLLFVAFSCSKDDDPADNDIFVGTYDGKITYTDGDGDAQSHDNGNVTVVKRGSLKYDFHFSDGIPNLTGIEFEEEGDHTLVNVDLEEGVTYIKIDESTLDIFYTKDGAVWTADCER